MQALTTTLSRLSSLEYDIQDVKSTHWHEDFSAYKNSVKDLEVMLQNVINAAFEGAPTTQAGVELLDAYRDAIERCVETKRADDPLDCMRMILLIAC